MGVVHHAAYLPYLEEARVAYLRSIGHPYDDGARAGRRGGWWRWPREHGRPGREFPVVEVSVRYRRPLRFDEEVDVSLVVGRRDAGRRSRSPTCSVSGVRRRATAVTVHGCTGRPGRPVGLPGWMRPSSPPEGFAGFEGGPGVTAHLEARRSWRWAGPVGKTHGHGAGGAGGTGATCRPRRGIGRC